MALPQGIFESFQENPGTDLDDTTGASVLDTMNENSPLFKILGKNSQLISKQRLPEQNIYAPKSDYEVSAQPQSDRFSDGEREIPNTQDLIASRLAKLNETRQVQPVTQKPVLQYEPIQKAQQIQQPVYNVPQASAVIDYSLINSMLKSIVEEQFKGIKSQLLTEGKNSGLSQAAYFTIGGGAIRFIDKKNNIYEGKLKLVGNINDQSI